MSKQNIEPPKSWYVVKEINSHKQTNFYDTKLNGSKHWALECKRTMKSLSGKDHEVVVKIQDVEDYTKLEDYEKSNKR